jgi:hypothetical protein
VVQVSFHASSGNSGHPFSGKVDLHNLLMVNAFGDGCARNQGGRMFRNTAQTDTVNYKIPYVGYSLSLVFLR